MYYPVYEIVSIAGLAIVLEVGLAIWVGNRLAQLTRRSEEPGCDRVVDSPVEKPSK
jgi:hypothetical protein